MERGPTLFLCFDPDTTTMSFDHTTHVCQTDSGSRKVFDAVEALEYAKNLVRVLHVETDTVVTHGENKLAGVFTTRDVDNGNTSRCSVFHRVFHQVPHQQPEHHEVALHNRQCSNVPGDLTTARLHVEIFSDFRDDRAQIDTRQMKLTASHTRELEQPINKTACEFGTLENRRDESAFAFG